MFNDENLNEIAKNNHEKINSHIKFLDDLSKDIRTLESFLCKSAIPAPFNVVVSDPMQEEGSIIWNGKNLIWFDFEKERKLIETPKEIRIRCKPYLVKLFEKLMKNLGEK